MQYKYITNYKNNDILRKSFNELTEKTYSFNFVEWFQNGFWDENYIPYSLADGEKIIANVSVNKMDFMLDGAEKRYIQIGTVMTDKAYGGQGLSRYLMEKVIEEYVNKVDGIYLFANDQVLNFYPKFGFIKKKEYQYSKLVDVKNDKQILHINMTDSINRIKFLETAKNCANNERFSMHNFGLIAFITTGPMINNIYYCPVEDAYVVADIKEGELLIHQIISLHRVNLDSIINSFGNTIGKVYLGFTPYDSEGYEINEYYEEDCTLFCLGKDFENIDKRKLMFPTLSHA
ncbi:GNAT family N-acetyltransferase [Anaerocolumna aminovalerica]|uniref:Acetyltransferase (GNAT) domain-containing protein n=1 Tax=Anaerocolumna aminovalerica TaxID=1527 RepID=A0A1I5HQA8_9FIRM|nr:GNAT family N-acetyltransferase [Anaerocolumna aminovalerica]SFO50453.1 Acetyltransferase (GNAT) domain-containing protein [Anaerocolumna aminovalerica]